MPKTSFRGRGVEQVTHKPQIAVVAMQGDFEKHLETLRRLGAEPFPARLPADIERADGIILPGGESTTIGKLMARYGVDEALRSAAQEGKPIYGTCAGLILLARQIAEGTGERGRTATLGLLDATVARNAFGRQVDSFEARVEAPALGDEPLQAVFIRAPTSSNPGRASRRWRPTTARPCSCARARSWGARSTRVDGR